MRLHATFLLFLGWFALVGGSSGLALMVGLFACVLLHEFGHALTARRYGVGTRDITLYPIGGVAMLEGRLRARQELWVALAGPAVNLVLAGGLLLGLRLANGRTFPGEGVVSDLAVSNLLMAGFNMIPAFPMDGGRVLRALLARWMPDLRATRIAAGVGQACAVGLFAAAFLLHLPLLAFVAVFVFMGAGQERRTEAARAAMSGHRLGEAMRTGFRTLSHGERLGDAVDLLRETPQRDFPVLVADEPVGIVSRDQIVRGLAEKGPDAYVAGQMRRDPKIVAPDASLESVAEMFSAEDPSSVLVMEDGHLIGLVSSDSVGEFLRSRAYLG